MNKEGISKLKSITAPLCIRYGNGEKHIVAEKYIHKEGFLYFEPYWHQLPFEESVHFVAGMITGEGPWKIGNAVITLIGCQGSDPQMATELADWQQYLLMNGDAYPSNAQIDSIAKQLGAII